MVWQNSLQLNLGQTESLSPTEELLIPIYLLKQP